VANAFFDSGSEVTLCSSSLVERLEVYGPETLRLNTINGDCKSQVYVIDKIAMRTVYVPRDQLQRYAHLRNLNLPSIDEEVRFLLERTRQKRFASKTSAKEKGSSL